MLKLMKYELLKQRTSKLILGGFLLAAELAFILGIVLGREDIWALAVVGLVFVTFAGFLVVGLEAIFTYFTDMKEKRGYMLFMTPNSVYSILGSKLLTSILTIAVWILLIGLLAAADVAVLILIYSNFEVFMEQIRFWGERLFSIQIDWFIVALVTLEVFFNWVCVVTSAFLAITISMLLLSGHRFRGIISFILYIIINLIPVKILSFLERILHLSGSADVQMSTELAEQTASGISLSTNGAMEMGLMFVITVVFAVSCFFFTGVILKKRLSL